MSEPDLHAAVARAIAEAMYATEAEEQVEVREAAAAAIRVVLPEAQRAVEQALDPREPWDDPQAVALAALAALGKQVPAPYDEPMIGGPHEVTNQYHPEPDRDPRQ